MMSGAMDAARGLRFMFGSMWVGWDSYLGKVRVRVVPDYGAVKVFFVPTGSSSSKFLPLISMTL